MNANSYLHRFGGASNIAGCPPVGTVAKIFETALQTAHNSLVNSPLPPHGKDAETDEDGYSPLHNARAAARPLLFRTGIAEVPVGICGTTFLVGRKGRVFLITAAHLIRDAHSEIVLVFPCDGSQTPLTLSNGFSVGLGDGHSDEYDVIVYEIT